ncbi:hypothetical protein DFO66_103347 [Brevibacterium sanguinis]|uniref:Uncharacterized protein n=2 Tax=Brevibacterium TaxID=1696 RepID=A0A366IKW2_9MICO|nr:MULTISPECIES: hypothetical protein [Brevibacterium]RBP66400.1 hypothetical protein DFO66_103347 [Brevibacterium sanguinis]RBP73052.1 hypothetical protein DFO65_103347 [Brevibacterium celere]
MTDDLTAWLAERREKHHGGWTGQWSAVLDGDDMTLHADGAVPFDLVRSKGGVHEYRGAIEDLAAIVDAQCVASATLALAFEQRRAAEEARTANLIAYVETLRDPVIVTGLSEATVKTIGRTANTIRPRLGLTEES